MVKGMLFLANVVGMRRQKGESNGVVWERIYSQGLENLVIIIYSPKEVVLGNANLLGIFGKNSSKEKLY